MRHRSLLSAAVLAFAALLLQPAVAQDNSNMTPDQLRELFDGQKTRGLVIAPAPETPGGQVDATGAVTGTDVAPAAYAEVPEDLQVNIQIRFDFDSAALKDSEKPKLASLCEAMKTADVEVFRIVGHTDSTGADAYNQKLSQLRAEEVKRYLVSDCGIDDSRLLAVGVGKAHPYDAADPAADVNRRVEFQVVS